MNTDSVTQKSEFRRMQVFTGGEGGYANYRCPAIVRTARGTLLLSPDARNTGSDWGWIDLLLSRSTDGGRTWSPPQVISRWDGEPSSNPVSDPARRGGDGPARDPSGRITFSNQCLIPDADGRVHLIYFVEYCRAMYRVSEDDGVTWRDPVEITASAFEPYWAEYPWKVIAAGPGAGIQLSRGSHKGRLVAPFWMSRGGAEAGSDHRPSNTGTIYSDDGGRTWLPGAITARHGEMLVNPSENVLVELSDGSVMVNIRSESPEHRRAVAISPDGISNWSRLQWAEDLWEPVCHAGLTRLAGVPGHEKTLAFSNPDTAHKPEPRNALNFCARENLTVRVSLDEGRTWTARRVIEPGPSGYSALTSAPDGTIWCAFEHRTGDGPSNISVAAFNLAWVLQGE